MDVLSTILRIVRETIEATGAPPDGLQDWLAAAEDRARRSVGGSVHHISRIQPLPVKTRIVELSEQGLTAQQISERLGVSDRYVRQVRQRLRAAE